MKMLVALALTFVLACEALADSTLDKRLFDAATSGDAEAVVALLDAGADPNAKHTDGDTPLHIAAYKGHTEAIAALLASRVAGEVPHLNTSNAPTRGGCPVFVHRRAATSLESQRSTLDASQSRTLARRSVKSSGGSVAITSHLNAW